MAADRGSDGRIEVVVEATPRRAAASAADWPGWSRLAKTEQMALEALLAAAPRYATVAALAGETFSAEANDVDGYRVVERVEGGSGTEFGVPSMVTDLDRKRVDAGQAERLVRLLDAAWTTFDRVAATAPAELRKGPRGGGRDRDKIVGHVVESEHAYAREIGIRVGPVDPGDRPAIDALRSAIRDVLRAPSDGSPLAGRRWTTRYASRRIAWHLLDHAWEMEDRTEPA